VTSNRASSRIVAYPEMLAAARGPSYGEGRCCAVVVFSSHASICGDIFISWGPRFSPYGDTVDLSLCFDSPAILMLCVNPHAAVCVNVGNETGVRLSETVDPMS
jgi:hypothetical protein